MQHLRQQVEALEYNLVETKNELRKVSGSLDLVEQHIDKIQRQLELSHDWPHTEDTAAGRDQDQTVDRLWQELNRLGNKEDRLRQEKLIIVQLELTLYEALLQLQSRQGNRALSQAACYTPSNKFFPTLADLQQDIEAGGRICKHEDPITGKHTPCVACQYFVLFALQVATRSDVHMQVPNTASQSG